MKLQKNKTTKENLYNYASIKEVEARTGRMFEWHRLRNYCTAHELEMPKIFDLNYGSVSTYPAKAWHKMYGIDLKKLF